MSARIGSAALVLALATSMAPSYVLGGADRAVADDNVPCYMTPDKGACLAIGVREDGKVVGAGNAPANNVVVTLTSKEDGKQYKSSDGPGHWTNQWQNFGLAPIPYGTYDVSLSGLEGLKANDLTVSRKSTLRDGATLEVTDNTPNIFVDLVKAQFLTIRVKVDGSNIPSVNDPSAGKTLPESIRDLVVTLTSQDGEQYRSSAGAAHWVSGGAYSVAQNFDLEMLPLGTYTVSISGLDDLANDDLKVKNDSVIREDATVEITGNTPDLFIEFESTDNKNFEPEYQDGSGKPGVDSTVPGPTFKDKDGKETKAPEGTKFTPGEGAPEGSKVDENTGEVTVSVPEGAKPGDKITVPVVVTYPDGSTDTAEVTVTVDGKDSDKYQPEYPNTTGKVNDKTEIPLKPGDLPAGTKCEVDPSSVPSGWKASVDKNCTLTVEPGKDAKPGQKADIKVNFTYPDGSTDTVAAHFEIAKSDAIQKSKLARTGAQVAGLAGIAAAMGVAGLGLVLVRRRREGEEN
ncbi:YPDG domain-containing protein [Actinomycetaceae bacterium UMB8039B]|uniref:YPDG domain-containing protein n=1 Tax=Pauljensenia sp. UMB8040A TaxID=3046343 RepID=UPI00254B407A|nr:YPDG domain-containing protein [Pauljensenia sp. UMB8040A]MDK7780689.1 YPDG domain-containing protein [Actinomycetaceae bacterium UMB8041B]MDK8293454.1 YPDG domain-containing protein [Actinomycetaceae bacterium UMB8039B]MDK8607776.1 YPDG domain-containing protein [Actinomycetaceae bacterium UMB8041A]MDK8752860.1 YPDG domain-containing protein [Actinomycetaceae bacterium UMB8039A]MDK6830063.1 YPDG domain-containing protein [Pauljensenia sp. UMB8040A]